MARKKAESAKTDSIAVKLNVVMVALAHRNIYTNNGVAVVSADELETLKKMGVVDES